MKPYLKVIAVFCAAAIGFSGCGTEDNSPRGGTDTELTAEQNAAEITLYVGNENGDGLVTETVTLEEFTPEAILQALSEKNIVPKEVQVLDFKDEGESLTLDLSQEYQEYASSYGTSGELVIVGGVVNTFLDAYEADTITILVEGKAWDTGHAEYSGALGRY